MSTEKYCLRPAVYICCMIQIDLDLNRALQASADNARHFELLGGNKVENQSLDLTEHFPSVNRGHLGQY